MSKLQQATMAIQMGVEALRKRGVTDHEIREALRAAIARIEGGTHG